MSFESDHTSPSLTRLPSSDLSSPEPDDTSASARAGSPLQAMDTEPVNTNAPAAEGEPSIVDVYVARLHSGLYDDIAKQLGSLPHGLALSEATLGKNVVKEPGPNGSTVYRRPDGAECELVLVGELQSAAQGTKFSARGNHYISSIANPKPIVDTSVVKSILVLGKPRHCIGRMAVVYNNQLASLQEVVDSDFGQLEEKASQNITIKEPYTSSDGDPETPPDLIIVHTGKMYVAPKASSTPSKRRKITKQDLSTNEKSIIESTSTAGTTTAASTSSAPATGATSPASSSVPPVPEIKTFYDPRVLPDYGGSLFQHQAARLRQLDIRNVENNPIHPSAWYSELREGTLVLVSATAHCYNYSDGGKERRIYQLEAQTIRVIDRSDEPIEPRSRWGSTDNTPSTSTDPLASIAVTKRRRDEDAQA
ncbi:hypothetical protein CONPUDRAFT_152789 [Coniophora puteana RWD-64-598 SS2]|uniref:Uncharacterized protein n=1 Tax=Coniophora puteana (strain RWD-64-598) TaxID=741705 RepID=A0A5M3MRV8_CONPW|nr:uncharacterized protein CONPUDRAFT_152789 [Coniophora puteana RWD-64-598 SS2]EIW81889.1 hypothetical protein CONPUDRAFT_152789 [Coniophora puteana RWD-64-598 SS2]